MISECHLRKQAQAQADPLDSDDAMLSERFNAWLLKYAYFSEALIQRGTTAEGQREE